MEPIDFNDPRFSKIYDSTKIETIFPFILNKDGNNMISVECDEGEVYNIYGRLFEKYNKGTGGFSWASLIKLILSKENPELRKHLDFDPEGGGFYVYADNEESQRSFFNLMGNLFSDTVLIEEYLKNASDEDFQYNPNN